MDWIVTTARTVEEAQSRALDLLGVDTADAEIQVLEEGKTGLFGRTKSEARVRARIKPKAPAAKEERRPNRGGDRNRSRGSKGGGSSKGGQRSAKRSNRESGGRSNGDGGGRESSGRTSGDGGRESGGRGRDGGGRSRAGSGGRGRGDGGDGGAKRSRDDNRARSDASTGSGNERSRSRNRSGGRDRARSERSNEPRGGEDRVEMPVAEQRETLEAFVTGVALAFDDSAKVELVEEGTTLLAKVNGGDLGRLVGAKASTLQSLEELARTAMHRAAEGRRYHRIQVDVDNYRARRREALAQFATQLATSVAETGQSKAMEPMGAADRKLVHDAVAEVEGVETYSEGRDPRRYIVITATNAGDEEE